MPLNSLGQLVPSHKTWDHVGNMIPDVEHSEGERPAGEFKPAAWLPTQFFDKYHEEYYVVMPGKILACDNDGRIVPAQYGLGAATITYTAADVAAGVIDVRTGAALLAANTGTFTVASVTAFMGRTGVAMAVSKPLGVAPYGYLQWAGDGSEYDDGFNPVGFRKHNHNLQHQVALLCDYVLELPLVPATVASAAAITENTNASNVTTFNAVSNLPVAANTVRTPITFTEGVGAPGDVAARFAVQKDNVTDIAQLGDWHIDLETGVISVFSTASIGATDYEVTYSHYASAPTGSSVSKYACALGDLTCGDFLVANADSNWVKAGGSATFQDIMGQVIEVENILGKDALDKVRTAYNPAIDTDASGSYPGYTGQMDQMPGSATGGVTDKVHYAGAANLVVRINLVSR